MSPSPENVVIAVDIGTSGVRAIAYSEALVVEGEASRSYSFETTADGGAEQDVTEVAEATLACIREVVREIGRSRVVALSFCGTASCLAAFARTGEDGGYDADGPAWIWADVRAREEAAALRKELGDAVYRRTACPAHASYWPAKIQRWRGKRPELLRSDDFILAGIKDYVIYGLTGEWLVDVSTAAATGLYDSQQGVWDGPSLDWLQLSQEKLPRIAGVREQRPLLPGRAGELGLEAATPVVVGSLDGVLAHLGAGCAGPTMASCMIGTSGAVRLGATERRVDRQARTWTYPLTPSFWVTGGANNSGGNLLAWFGRMMDGLVGDDHADRRVTPERILALASDAGPGAGGLFFLPTVFGERSPLWREDLRGAWIGLAPTHGAPELCRAVVEGISLNLATILEALVDQVGEPKEARATGGFTASEFWLQLQADVFGLPISLPSPSQPTAAGAAIVGWSALTGTAPEAWIGRIGTKKTVRPDPEMHLRYREMFGEFKALQERML